MNFHCANIEVAVLGFRDNTGAALPNREFHERITPPHIYLLIRQTKRLFKKKCISKPIWSDYLLMKAQKKTFTGAILSIYSSFLFFFFSNLPPLTTMNSVTRPCRNSIFSFDFEALEERKLKFSAEWTLLRNDILCIDTLFKSIIEVE